MAYHIQLPQFEGPLELLLSLIEKQKLDITQVSLAKITDQYLEYISNKNSISLENLAWFLVIASRLILIKSKALLPTLELDADEEENVIDLEWQLKEYKKFKDASLKLKGMFDAGNQLYSRVNSIVFHSVFYPPSNVTVETLEDSFMQVLRDIPVSESLEKKVIAEVVTIEEKIISLQEMLRKKIEASFSDIIAHSKNKSDVIVSFLAMLELVKQRIVQVEQKDLFQAIQFRMRPMGKKESVSKM